nr:unnamed protein product [Callosobruchus chinensis]
MAENLEEINDESELDQDDGNCLGYYTRSSLESRKRKNPIMFVPTEIIQAVFRHISYQELSQNVRLVNHRFKLIAEGILDSGFKNIDRQLTMLQRTTELSLAYTQDDMEIKCITKLLNFLEILKTQHTIVLATIWRYVYNEFYKVPKSSMYGGQLIDAHKLFMWTFLHFPNQLYAPAVVRDYALPVEVTKIVQLTKAFCLHFERVTEEPMPNCLIRSGCKMVDLLDAAKFAQKTTIYEKSTKDSFIGQRMMHMRLRRLVLAHNDMFLQQAQYERELMLRPVPNSRIKKPGNNVYTGYGDVGHFFFYYGVMNDGAFAQKFATDEDNEEEENDDEIDVGAVQEANPANLPQINSDEDILFRPF